MGVKRRDGLESCNEGNGAHGGESFYRARESRFLTGLSARFGMTMVYLRHLYLSRV